MRRQTASALWYTCVVVCLLTTRVPFGPHSGLRQNDSDVTSHSLHSLHLFDIAVATHTAGALRSAAMITQKGREAKPTILTSVVNALLSVAKAKRALSQIFKLQHCMTVSAQPLVSADSRLEPG